jgi:hypothetical protein
MTQEITESFLQAVAGDVEKLLLEDRENIAFAFTKIPDGIKLNLGINLDWSKDGIVVNYALAFDLEPKPEPIEKHKVVMKRIINQAQAALEFISKGIEEGRMSLEFPDGTKIEKTLSGRARRKRRHNEVQSL